MVSVPRELQAAVHVGLSSALRRRTLLALQGRTELVRYAHLRREVKATGNDQFNRSIKAPEHAKLIVRTRRRVGGQVVTLLGLDDRGTRLVAMLHKMLAQPSPDRVIHRLPVDEISGKGQ